MTIKWFRNEQVIKEILSTLLAVLPGGYAGGADVQARTTEFDYEPVGGPPAKLGEHIRAEIARWASVVKAAGVRVD